MAISNLSLLAQLSAGHISAWWRGWGYSFKLAAGASILVVGGLAHLGVIVAGQIRENAIQQSASAPALYIGSFVEPYIQELATKEYLSTENLEALERLLSPVSMQRPVVAFRIWKGDRIVFSNERQLIGKTFATSASRERAWSGEIAVEFDYPGGDDDEQVRSLKVPILEVYSPQHERGTSRIIAIVETYEIAVDLKSKLWASQFASWLAIVAVALAVILLLFSIARTGSIEQHFLLNRIAESERGRQKIGQANLKVGEMSERSLAQIETALHQGPTQYVTLALLKLGSLAQLVKAKGTRSLHEDQYQEELEAIRGALSETLRQIRSFASRRLPDNIHDLSVAEVIAKACRRHERRTGAHTKFETVGLPDQLPPPLKVCLYRITLEGLNCAVGGVGAQAVVIRASLVGDRVALEIIGSGSNERPELAALHDRLEAVGGTLSVHSTAAGQLTLIAELELSDMELADG